MILEIELDDWLPSICNYISEFYKPIDLMQASTHKIEFFDAVSYKDDQGEILLNKCFYIWEDNTEKCFVYDTELWKTLGLTFTLGALIKYVENDRNNRIIKSICYNINEYIKKSDWKILDANLEGCLEFFYNKLDNLKEI